MSRLADAPYPGFRAFQQADHDHFFGRSAAALAIADLWLSNHLTVLSGPVASGKTSLLNAGIYPLMADRRSDVLPPGSLCCGAAFPAAALPEHNPYRLSLLRSWQPHEAPARLAGMTVSEFIRRRAQHQSGIVLAAIDQAEDLLADSASGPRRASLRQFITELAQVVADEPRLHLMLVTRSDALEHISTMVGNGARYTMGPLSVHAAIEAVTGPITGTGRSFAEGAAEKLVLDLQTSRLGRVSGNGKAEQYVTAE